MSANPWLKYHRQAAVKAATAGGTPAPAPITTVNPKPPVGATVVTRPFSRAAVNREAMPQVAAAVDQLRKVFGPVQVIFASEGGKELGREPPPGVKPVITDAGAPKRTTRKGVRP